MSTLPVPTRSSVGRPLGIRAEPVLRLSIGAPKPAKGPGRPIDYFRAKEGPDGAHTAAADKFRRVYGDKPTALDIILPAELRQALDVRHKAWGGGGDEDGGVLKAIGHTNFAEVGTLGGPDTLTVWRQDGTVDELDIDGADDPAAAELGVELYTTFRFHLVGVTGLGSCAEITSKGAKTTDQLFARLAVLYGMLGARVSFAIKPKLVMRKTRGRPAVVDKQTGELKRITSTYYALDLYVPESLEEMFERLASRSAALGNPTEAMYGPRALTPGDAVPEGGAPPDGEEPTQAGAGDATGGQAEDGAPPAPSSASPDAPEPKLSPGPADWLATVPAKAIEAAGKTQVPEGDAAGKTISEIADTPDGATWLLWAVGKAVGYWPDDFRAALELFVRARHPDVLAAHEETAGMAS